MSTICDLFTVIRTDKTTGDRVTLTYPPTDYVTALKRADHYQRNFDHEVVRFYYRVSRVS